MSALSSCLAKRDLNVRYFHWIDSSGGKTVALLTFAWDSNKEPKRENITVFVYVSASCTSSSLSLQDELLSERSGLGKTEQGQICFPALEFPLPSSVMLTLCPPHLPSTV